MNYYEHHLGDWAKDTVHLTMLEEGAYRRLVDVYYIKEKPLPKAIREIYKLARAAAKPEREAVDAVLREFFLEREDGWHHKRCDEELARYAEGQEDAEGKRENDKERQRRARERRKVLFEQLRGHGIVPAWDTKTSELEAQLSRVTASAESRPGHALVTPPVTCDNTATSPQSPVPSPQVLNTNTSEASPLHPPTASPLNGKLNGHSPHQPELPDCPEQVDTEPPPCPHDQLRALYAKHFPQLTQPRVWDGARAEAMRVRWRQCAKPGVGKGYRTVAEGLAFWDRYFAFAASCQALRDGIPRENGSRWYPDLPWLVKAENFAKVIEGKYAS